MTSGMNGTNVDGTTTASSSPSTTSKQYEYGGGSEETDVETRTQLTIELNTDMTAAQRFPIWILLTVSSIICVIALDSRKHLFDVDSSGEKWVLAVGSISFVLSLLAVFMYLCCRMIFVSNIPEAVMVGLLLAFWAAGLPTIMNPNNRIAVAVPQSSNVASVVTNANLYFFSWASFCCTIYLAGSLLQDTMNVQLTNIAAKAARWFGLVASSLVVLGTSVRVFKSRGCQDPDIDLNDETTAEYCRRTKFAISIGVISFIISCIMTYLVQQKKQLTACSDIGINTMQLIFWCFGVSFITFGTSPGSTIGNLYFSTWISFILCVFSFGVSFREYAASRQMGTNTQPPQPEFDETI